MEARPLARPPAFFLAEGRADELEEEEAQHARKVLRLAVGDLLIGLDGAGLRRPLRVRALTKHGLLLEPAGEPEFEPAPGAEGSPLPWFELAIAWPRRNRVEDMVNRLVQLGVAAIRPLRAEQRGPEDVPDEPPERVRRVAREAVKQSGRAWLPRFLAPGTVLELAASPAARDFAVLDPRAGLPLDLWLRSINPSPADRGTEARPIGLLIGPEGGLSGAERRALIEASASLCWLAPFVLRIETAAEAAMALAGAVHGRTPRSQGHT